MKRLLLLLPALLLFAGCLGEPSSSEEKVVLEAKDFLVRYYGVWDVNVTNASFKSGVWFLNVTYYSETGQSRTSLLVDDSNLSNKWELLSFITTPIGIAPIAGKLPCSEGGKLKVMLFTDPYCGACLRAEDTMAQLRGKFSQSIDFEYRLLLTDTLDFAKTFGEENASIAAKYFICAREQGNSILDPLKACALEKYKTHVGTPISKSELDECLPQAQSLDVAKFDSCLETASQLLDFDNKLAFTYLSPVPITPRVVIDCAEKATPNTAEYAICSDFQKNQTIAGCPPPVKKAKANKTAEPASTH